MNYELTINCVNKLRGTGLDQDILIVDNQSPNQSYKMMKEKYIEDDSVSIVQSPENGGYSYGNNFGFSMSKNKGYEYYCVMNPDIEINDSLFFNKLITIMNMDQKIAVISGVQVYANHIFGQYLNYWSLPNKYTGIIDHSFIDYFRNYSPKPVKVEKNYAYVDVLSGCCFVIRAEVIEKIGYLDDSVFLYYEENILSDKIKKLGLEEALCIDTVFYHNHENGMFSIKQRIAEKKIQISSREYFYKNYITQNIFFVMASKLFSLIDLIVSVTIFYIVGGIRNVCKIINNED